MSSKMRLFFIVFFLVNLFLASFHMDLWHNMNATSRALPVITYFENGSFKIDKYQEKTCDKSFVNGHYYTDKAPLPTWIVIPFFGALKSIGFIKAHDNSLLSDAVFVLGDFICGTIPFVLAICLAFFYSYKNVSSSSPVILTMLPFYASFMFVFSGTYFNHLFSGILLLTAYINIKNKHFLLAGVFAGLSFLSEYTIAIIFPIWALQIWYREKNLKKAILFSLGIMPSFIAILFYNNAFTGHPFEMLYKYVSNDFVAMKTNYGFNLPQIKALWSLTFSQYKGLFFYSPFLALLLFYSIKRLRGFTVKRLFNNYLAPSCILYLLFVSSYYMWWGGWTYGPRHLTVIAMLLTFEGVIYFSRHKFNKAIFWILTGFGFLSAFLAKSTVLYSIPSEIEWPLFQTVIPKFLSKDINPNNLLTIFFDMSPVTAMYFWLILFTGITFVLYRWFKNIQHQEMNISNSVFADKKQHVS